MKIGLLGTNHKKITIKDLEPIYIGKEDAALFITQLPHDSPIQECVILNTCNRLEFYFVAENHTEALSFLKQEIASFKQTSSQVINQLLDYQSGDEATQHLFRVTSGLESMVLGENEVLAQVKEAYQRSKALNQTQKILNKVFQTAIAIGKRVRTETTISRGAYSVSSIGIEAIRETILDYFGCRILINGMGAMGLRSLKKLHALGHPNITLCNRTFSTAETLAKEHNCQVLAIEQLPKKARDFDIIISTASVKEHCLSVVDFNQTYSTSLIVDLGLPRNIDPQLEEKTSIKVITVEGLKDIASQNGQKRKAECHAAETIIQEDAKKLMKWAAYKHDA